MRRFLIGLPLIALSALAGIGCGATLEQLRKRAAFDFNCPAGSLEVVEIDKRTRGVSGCGQRATYIEDCRPVANSLNGQTTTTQTDCTWVMNSDSRPAAPTPMLAPPPTPPQ